MTPPVYHVIPETGILPHEQSISCWCGPELVTMSALRNVIARHHAYDNGLNPIPTAPVDTDTENGSEDEEE